MTLLIKYIQEISVQYKKNQVSAMATKLTFYIILSAVPFMICLFEAIRLTNITDTSLFYDLASILPDSITSFIQLMSEDIQNSSSGGILPLALVIALWSSSRGINALIHSLNRSYGVNRRRNFITIRLISFLYTLAFIVIIIVVAALIIFGSSIYHTILSYVTLPAYLSLVVTLLRYAVSILLVFFFLIALYNITPNTPISFKDVLPGSAFSTLAIISVSAGFSFYVNNSFSLSYLYGSLTNIVIVMLWLYIVSNIIIIGGEINAMFLRNRNISESDALSH